MENMKKDDLMKNRSRDMFTSKLNAGRGLVRVCMCVFTVCSGFTDRYTYTHKLLSIILLSGNHNLGVFPVDESCYKPPYWAIIWRYGLH